MPTIRHDFLWRYLCAISSWDDGAFVSIPKAVTAYELFDTSLCLEADSP
jgi:hypothetical protein